MKKTVLSGSHLTRRNFLCASALGLAALFIPSIAKEAKASTIFPENTDLSSEQIAERTKLIHSTYKVGDILSDADAEFIELYGFNHTSRASWVFSGSRYFAGNNFQISGNKYINNTWEDEYTFGGTVQGGSPGVTSNAITTYYSIMAYGLVGLGYEVIYQDVQHKECHNVPWCTHEYYGSFFGACSTQTITCWAEFSTDYGSFVVHEG